MILKYVVYIDFRNERWNTVFSFTLFNFLAQSFHTKAV